MNRIAAFALLVAVIACNKKKEDAPTSTPTAPGSAAPTPPPTPVVPDPAPKAVEAAKPPTPCAVTLHVAADRITLEGGATGQAKTPADLTAALSTVDHACSVVVGADDTTAYQQVITVFDQLTKDGFTSLALDTPGKPIHAGEPTVQPKTSPVVSITKTKDLIVDGKQLGGKPLKPMLEAAKSATGTTSFIVQADKSLTYKDVRDVVAQAAEAGYTDVLFAVKTK